tara:strand:+ start:334 stop:1554 length:1221 start_codon:yes stop_codon:yes gene_type:complete
MALTNKERVKRRREEIAAEKKEMGTFAAFRQGLLAEDLALQKLITQELETGETIKSKSIKGAKDYGDAQKKSGDAIAAQFPTMSGLADLGGGMLENTLKMIPGFGQVAIAAIAVFKVASKINAAIADTRKELGVSYANAALITLENKKLAQIAKGFGLTTEDISSAQSAIREDLGASVRESLDLSVSFARTAAATGQTAGQLGDTLSLMESISSSSREVLLNQIRTNAAMIEAAGIAPALVMRDLAENAEFFAQFAKDGGGNIIQAGIAARKLGLEMSTVAGISESLLNFESSIESQMEASLLLGRQINLDKARQLALAGDQEGVMKEILKAVGGEAEFNRMNVIQRKKLAESVGVNVEQLSRLVRNNTAGGTAGAVGAAMGGGRSEEVTFLESIDRKIGKVAGAL